MLIDRSIKFTDQVAIAGRSTFSSQIEAMPQRQERRDPYPISPRDIVIVEKKSRWELDQEKLGCDHEGLSAFYRHAGVAADRIFESHVAQLEARATIRRIFSEAVFIGREQIDYAVASSPKLMLSLGGDNHAQWVSHFVLDETPFIGVNSDPSNSVGALLQAKLSELEQLREDLLAGSYQFYAYTRLRVELNGRPLPAALSEVFIGDKYRMNISRYFIEKAGCGYGPIEQKDSGLLIATGSGSTGWFRSSVRSQFHFSPQFEPTTEGAAYHATESQALDQIFTSGVILRGEKLSITSRFNRSGVISIDSDEDAMVDFARGAVANVMLDHKPLWVVMPRAQS